MNRRKSLINTLDSLVTKIKIYLSKEEMESSEELRALAPGELELIISCASGSDIKTLGNSVWIEWHQRFQKLHQQAVLESMSNQEEITKNTIISHGKIPVLIHEAVCISIWRRNIFPKILKFDRDIKNTFLLYAILYHETVAVGIIEIVAFDEETWQSISELIVDVIDYCIEMITGLIVLANSEYLRPKSVSKDVSNNQYEDLERQQKDLEFDIGIRCITIISCISNILDKVHISATPRLFNTHDTPMLIAELLQLEPWSRRDDRGNTQFYELGHWRTVEDSGEKLCRAETLTWLALWQLIMNSQFNNYYNINDFRKGQLCKLLNRITESHMDQVPILVELKRSLGQLSVANIPSKTSSKQPILIEVLPQIKPTILKIISKKEKTIAKMQLQDYFQPSNDELIELARRLSISYASDVLEHMEDGGPKCGSCKERASKKCSRCKSEWYCGRPCQVKHWNVHKKTCDKMTVSEK